MNGLLTFAAPERSFVPAIFRAAKLSKPFSITTNENFRSPLSSITYSLRYRLLRALLVYFEIAVSAADHPHGDRSHRGGRIPRFSIDRLV